MDLLSDSCAEPVYQAESLWRKYLAIDPKGGWSDEAEKHHFEAQRRIAKAKSTARISNGTDESLLSILESSGLELGFVRLLPALMDRDGGPSATMTVLGRKLALKHADHWLSDAIQQYRKPQAWVVLNAAIQDNRIGDYSKAEAEGRAAVAAFSKPGVDAAGRARSILEVLYSLQRTAKTRECLVFARNVVKDPAIVRYPWIQAHIQLFYGGCHYYEGHFSEGLAYIDKAQEIARLRGFDLLFDRVLQFKAPWLRLRGDLGTASALASRGLHRYWANGGPPDYAQNHIALLSGAGVQAGLHRFHAAASRERIALCRLMDNPTAEAMAWVGLGNASIQFGAKGEALNAFREAGALLDRLPKRPEYAIFRVAAATGLARAEIASGNPRKALSLLQIAGESAMDLTNATSIAGYFGARADAETAIGLSSQAEESARKRVILIESGAASKSIQDRLNWARASTPAYRELARRMHERGDHRGSFEAWQRHQAADVSRPVGKPPNLGDWLKLSPGSLQSKTEVPGRFLSYAVFDDGILMWIVDGRNIVSKWLPISRIHLMRIISTLKAGCSDPSFPVARLHALGREVYSLLLAPAAGFLAAGNTLSLQLDGPLRDIPFQALQTPKGMYLGAVTSIEILASAFESRRSPRRLGGAGLSNLKILAIGSPMLHSEFAGIFPPLPDAVEEATTIATHFGKADLLLGKAATSEAVRGRFPSVNVFHFAGHAQGTMDGAVLMLAPSHPADRGAWRGGGLRTGELERCNLAVFSACASAKVEDEFIAEPLNLVGTFLASGVAQVVASGWMVDSSTSADMMKVFYRELASGRNVVDSLREASSMIRSRAGKEHPYFWAPYAVFGAGAPQEMEQQWIR